MKRYVVKFWRTNYQLKNNGYETTRVIEAKDKRELNKEIKRIEKLTRYGGLTCLGVEEI